jgi:flagellar biosynthetic protein FliQ
MFQAVTQINEATLAFLPKVMAIGVAMMVAGSYMFTALADFARLMFARLVDIGTT